MAAQAHDVSNGSSIRPITIVLEVILGIWLIFLFIVALAWDPIDRRLGFRAKRIAERAELRAATGMSFTPIAIDTTVHDIAA